MFRAAGSFAAVLLLLVFPGAAAGQEAPATPGDGYTIHVTAPHLIGDRLVDPMHHYCKVISDAPMITCLMFESNEPNAQLVGIEYIAAKSVVRNEVPLADWNRDWHDHAVEIESGVVKLPGMPEEDAAKTAALVSGTDGIVFMTWPHGATVPDGKVVIAQAISHNLLTPAEYAGEAAKAPPAE